ncbi:MAG: hypothetical protein HZB51_34325 [Chloroflexi bacterium]|nr:hypothetical protein [Chloroflexota bacterium]
MQFADQVTVKPEVDHELAGQTGVIDKVICARSNVQSALFVVAFGNGLREIKKLFWEHELQLKEQP